MLNNIQEIISDVDAKLIRKNIPIKIRCVSAIGEISDLLDVPIPIYPDESCPVGILGEVLCREIYEWYGNRYGLRQRLNNDLGCFIIFLRGDFWFCRIPDFHGTCNFFICQDLSEKGNDNETNILNMIEGMTQDNASSLTDSELEMIYDLYLVALEASETLDAWRFSNLLMYEAAVADLNSATQHVISSSPHYGQAGWSYAQFIEKVIKSWLEVGRVEHKKIRALNHNISRIAEKYNEIYNNKITMSNISMIISSSGLRYDEVPISQNQIFEMQNKVFKVIIEIGMKPEVI